MAWMTLRSSTSRWSRPWTIRPDALVASANSALHEELLDLARAALDLPL